MKFSIALIRFLPRNKYLGSVYAYNSRTLRHFPRLSIHTTTAQDIIFIHKHREGRSRFSFQNIFVRLYVCQAWILSFRFYIATNAYTLIWSEDPYFSATHDSVTTHSFSIFIYVTIYIGNTNTRTRLYLYIRFVFEPWKTKNH